MILKFIVLSVILTLFSKSSLSQTKNKSVNLNSRNNVETFELKKNHNKSKIHVVKEGDTLISIAREYSIDKEIIIKANKLINENYIFVGQNLKIIDNSSEKDNHIKSKKNYHEISAGESLTEISYKYGLSVNELIKINNIENPNLLEVGTKLKVEDKSPIKEKITLNNKKNQSNSSNLLVNNKYGPLIIHSENSALKERRKNTLKATHVNGMKLILSIRCDSREINVRGIGRKWKGWMPVKEKFENQLLNDFC